LAGYSARCAASAFIPGFANHTKEKPTTLLDDYVLSHGTEKKVPGMGVPIRTALLVYQWNRMRRLAPKKLE
jgi:hypothetical protein